MYMNDGNKTKINLRNKSVFITGVAGFIGSNLAKRLLSTVEGVKVVGLDNMNHYYDVRLKEARLNELEQFDNFSFVKGNLADKAVIESIFEQYKPEIVVNLGAQAGVRYSITNPDAYVEANLIGFYNILEACRHSYDEGHTPVEHLVYASSSSVYGSNKKVPYSTDDKVDNPVSLYAATKKSNELMAHAYSKLYNIPCASESVSSVGTSANESVSSSSESQHEPVTITLYADSATNGANEAKIEAFQNLYPWITVDLVEMPAGASDRVRTLSTVLQAKDDSMDAFLIDCTWPEMFASAGWLEPLDDVYTSDELTEFSEGALQGCYVDGKLVCLPTFLNTGALLYRADLLEKYGFEPAKTWDELIEQSKVVMAGEPGVYGYAAAWQKAEALTCCTMEHIWGYDGNVLDENGNPTFDTEAVKSGISSMKKILDEGVAIDGILGMMSKDVKAAFFAGQVLYIRDWSVALAAANDPEQSSVAGNVKVAQPPAGTDGNEQYNCNGGWNIGVSAYSSHKEEAKLLVKYWTSDDAMLIGATMSGNMPARPALYGNKDLLAADSDMAKLYDFAKNCRNRPGSAYYEEVSTALQEGVTSVLMGEQSIDNAVATIQAKEEEIYNR